MKSNMSLVLVAVYFLGLIISLYAMPDSPNIQQDGSDMPSVVVLCKSLLGYRFKHFLTKEQLADKQFLASLYSDYTKAALHARELIQSGNNNCLEAHTYLKKSIVAKTIENPGIDIEQAAMKGFGGSVLVVSDTIDTLVDQFIIAVKNGK